MANSTSQCGKSQEWVGMYRAAISETDIFAAKQKISDAEAAIIARTRALFGETGPDAEVERDVLDDALYALRALRSASAHTK